MLKPYFVELKITTVVMAESEIDALCVAEAAAEALGNFVSDHDWSDSDMQAMDNLDSYIARHKAIRDEVVALKAERDSQLATYDKAIDNLQSQVDELVAALKGVIRVADRKTEEFDAARAAIAKAEGGAA